MSLLHIEAIPANTRAAFARKVTQVAVFLGIHPDWLMQVMWAESRLNPAAANRQGKDRHLVAAGLLQFTPGSGIVKAGKVPSIAHILSLPALAQLDLVEWYFKPYRNKMHSYYDVYAVTFFPAMVGKPDNWILQAPGLSAATIAKQNPAISKGRQTISVADFKHYTKRLIPSRLHERVFGVVQEIVQEVKQDAELLQELAEHPTASTGLGTGIIVGLCILGWFYLRASSNAA